MMPAIADGIDVKSTFSDGGGLFSFNLTKLQTHVTEHLGSPCTLRKLAEGGNHKERDIKTALYASEAYGHRYTILSCRVATLRLITDSTSVPVPKVLAWNSDLANSAGAEYMILEKIKGVPANTVWKDLKLQAKETLIRDVARSLLALFKIRFQKAGSLYSASGTSIQVGPLITTPFYRALDGVVRFPKEDPLDLSQFRGPFSQPSEFLSSAPKAELYVTKHRPDVVLRELDGDQARLDLGERVLEKVVRLAEIYPGNLRIGTSFPSDGSGFSLKLNDFRLSNIMIEQGSGRVLGLLDFEATTTAPLWMCAATPFWLDDMGDDDELDLDLAHLREIFNHTIKQEGETGEEWLELSERGRLFRDFGFMLEYRVQVWASEEMRKWVDARLAFASECPGVGLSEQSLEEDIAEMYENEA